MFSLDIISFDEILPVWRDHLWPDRSSAIETNSAIVYGSSPIAYDLHYMETPATFFGVFDDDKLIGVNSGHPTGNSYRSRGLYVFPQYRGLGLGALLLNETLLLAKALGFAWMWSMPRQSAWYTYQKVGFQQTGGWFGTETNDFNSYAIANTNQ